MEYLLLASVLFTAACYVNGQYCPKTGDRGNCVSIYKCPVLLSLVNKPNRTPANVDVLKRAACGFEGKTPKVCCPLPNEKPKNGCDLTITAFPPDSNTGCCGLDGNEGNKITIGGGVATALDQYPWLTLIEYLNSDNQIKLMCGGALISNRYVLTAAHCITGSVLDFGTPKNVRLGEYDTSHDGPDCIIEVGGGEIDCSDDTVIIPIDKTIPHPEYNPLTKRHDIGLIRLQRAAPYTFFIRPVCLPTVDITLNPPPRFKLFAAGWGAINSTHSKSAIKLHVELPYVNHEKCQPAYNVTRRQISLWKQQMCAGGEIGKDSCKGDSGGPLMYPDGRYMEVLGVVNFGPTPCGMEDVPGVYSKVIEYVDWIKSNIVP